MNWQQILDKIAQQISELLNMDVQMSGMNGIELYKNISWDYLALLKLIIIMTSRTDADIRIWAEPQQHIALMEKPLIMRPLKAGLEEHFYNQD